MSYIINKTKIEICVNSSASALIAQQAAADRVELCAGIPEGGTTPSYGTIKITRKLLSATKLHVIIRPRGGDFLYSEIEQETMLQDIKMCRQIGVDGVVFGGLTATGEIDILLMQKLMYHVGTMEVTFHRAFDMCSNPQKAVSQIIDLGGDRILTSGQETTAEKGILLLKELVRLASERIIIMPGGGVNMDNIMNIADQTGACEFHLSARSSIQSSMLYRNPKISMGGGILNIEEYAYQQTDLEKVKSILRILHNK
ncbi:MAG: copper homeostasis protein CutC [Chitinophagaceae bacterium]